MTDLITYVIGQLRGACWEEEAAAVEALVKERDELGRRLNAARYGQPDFAWSIHEEEMADLRAKLTKAVGFLKTMAGYNKYVIAPFLAELEKME